MLLLFFFSPLVALFLGPYDTGFHLFHFVCSHFPLLPSSCIVFFSVRSFQQKNSLSLPNFPQPCPKRQFPWWCVYLLCSLSTIIISCILSISPAVSLSAVSSSFFMRFTSLESPPRPFQWIFCPSHFSTFSFTILNFCLGLFAFVSPFPQRTHEIC